MNSKVRNFRTVCGVIAFFMFFFMLGAVGAVENNAVPLLPGAIRIFASLGLWAFFTWQSGAFDYSHERSERREVQRENPDARPGRTGREGPGPSGRAKNYR